MKQPFDTSTKEYEVLCKEYTFDKATRKLRGKPEWKHYRYYKTMWAALDALRDSRRSLYDKWYYDYPGADQEAKYPHLTPRITIRRYRARKR